MVQEVENEMMTRFESIYVEGRQIVKESRVELLWNLKIFYVIYFDSIMKDMRLKGPYQNESNVALDMYYSEDLVALAT